MTNEIFISTLLLSIAGGIVSAVYLAAERYIYKFTSARFTIGLNTAVIFTFVLPFYKLFFYLDGIRNPYADYSVMVFWHSGTAKSKIFEFLENSPLIMGITDVWLIGAILYVFLTFCYYFNWIHTVRKFSLIIDDKIWLEVLNRVCKQEQIAMDQIELVTNPKVIQPCTTGIYKKYIIVPEYLVDKLSAEEIELILLHELTHIKRSDVVFKIFIQILNCLHWYNPLLYILRQNLNDWIEMCCDEDLNRSFTTQQRKEYVSLLLKLVEGGRKYQKYALCFGLRKTKNFKRRIYAIMRINKRKGFLAKVIVLTMVLTTVSGASFVAKAADIPVRSVMSENMEAADEGMMQEGDAWAPVDEFLDYKSVDEVTLLDESQSNGQTKHIHKYEDTKLSQHEKKSNGSCVVTVFYAKHCTVCDVYLKGEVYNTITSTRCTH